MLPNWTRSLCLLLLLAALVVPPGAASAQDAPVWCEPDPPGPGGDPPPPRPRWSEIDGIPNYTRVADNIKISKTITLLVSVIEKGIQRISDAGSLASVPDVDGHCLCNCLGDTSKDAGYWLGVIGNTVKGAALQALQTTLGTYVDGLVSRLEHGLDVLVNTLPQLRADVQQALLDACVALAGGCTANDLQTLPAKLAAELGGVVKGEIEGIFAAEADEVKAHLLGIGGTAAAGMAEIKEEAQELIAFLQAIAQSDVLDPDTWRAFIRGGLKSAVVAGLVAARDQYVDTLLTRLQAVRSVLVNTLPEFRDDVRVLVENACTQLPTGCPKTAEAAAETMQAILDEIAEAAKAEITSIFEQEKDQILNALTGDGGPITVGMETLKAQVDDLVAQYSSLSAIQSIKWSDVRQAISGLFGTLKQVIANVVDESLAIAQSYTMDDLNQWIVQVAQAVEAKIAEKFANAPDVFAELEASLLALVQQRIEAIKASLDDVYEAATDYQSAIEVFVGTVLQSILGELGDLSALNPAVLKARIERIVDTTQSTLQALKDQTQALASLASSYTVGDLITWRDQVLGVAEAWLVAKYANGQQIFDQLKADLQAAVDARIQAIVLAAQDLYQHATNVEAVLTNFKTSLTQNLLQSLQQFDGCLGVTKRAECTTAPGGFCEGSPPGQIAGQPTPIWFPTEVFKDGKTALLFALEKLGFLDKIRNFLNENAPAWMMQAGKIVDALKNAQEVLDKIADYVNQFTDGYHLGTYGDARPDLHLCVGYGGHNAFARLFSFDIGKFTIEGGSKYWGHNLSRKHRAQFRSGGFALAINGKTIPLAPGVGLNVQIDGFRLWDRQYPFGLGRNADGSFWNAVGSWSLSTADSDQYDAFNLVDQSALEELCCGPGQSPPCGSCTLTPASFFTEGFFPVEYTAGGMTYEWPRDGVSWEEDLRTTAVFGAGLNLDLAMKTYRYEVSPPIVVFTGVTIVPFLQLDAGVKWLYAANHLRTALQDQLNASLPASEQLGPSDFERDMHRFQAPDVTEDAGTGANVAPQVGADLVLGIKLGKRFEIGITATVLVGVDVAIQGIGGLLDLNRALVETLTQSNPDGDDCKPIVENTAIVKCSSEIFAGGSSCLGDPDCIDATSGPPTGALVPTGAYHCGGGQGVHCEERGYCRDSSGKIVLHDVTREQCEAFEPGRCESQLLTWGTVAHFEPLIQGGDTTFGIASYLPDWLEFNAEQIEAAAALLLTADECESQGHCQGLSYQGPGTLWAELNPEPELVYATMYLGTAAGAAACPYGTGPQGQSLQGLTDPPTYLPFTWVPDGPPSGIVGATFFPYQCVSTPKTEVVGWEGPDCHPLAHGFPSACGCITDADCSGQCSNKRCSEASSSAPCTCEPQQGGSCPAGRVCVDGGCLKVCATDADCGPTRVCEDGGCVMANGIAYAEQAVWRARNVAEPMHAVASYAYNDLTVSAFLGVGVKVGFRFKLFKKWKEKNLLDLSETIPLLAKTFVKFATGLEAQYQSDCDLEQGAVINHQPGDVTRYTGSGSLEDFLGWCRPAVQSAQANPPVPDPQTTIMDNGLHGVHQFGIDLGLDVWQQHQLCIDGVPWYDYFTQLELQPDELWGRIECTYDTGTELHDLDCTEPEALQSSLLTALGCLDAAPPSAHVFSVRLAVLLQQAGVLSQFTKTYTPTHQGVATGAPRLVFDLDAILLDPDELFSKANLHPTILAQHGKMAGFLQFFSVDVWLWLLDQCSDDAPAGRMRDDRLSVIFPLDPDSLEICDTECEPKAQPPVTPACDGVFGDVNGNGVVNVADVQCGILAALWSLSGFGAGPPACLPSLAAADLNCDTAVDIADVLLCVAAVHGLPLPLGLDADQNGCPDACEAVCGDCVCDATESCATCSHDCGACTAAGAAGACCLPAGGCEARTAADCAASGGWLFGEGVACGGPDFCAQHAPGACCTNQGCGHAAGITCASQGGWPRGPFTSCATPGICEP